MLIQERSSWCCYVTCDHLFGLTELHSSSITWLARIHAFLILEDRTQEICLGKHFRATLRNETKLKRLCQRDGPIKSTQQVKK